MEKINKMQYITDHEILTIMDITKRLASTMEAAGELNVGDFITNLSAVHEACPLDLDGLLCSDTHAFLKELAGIAENTDGMTGKLLNNFIPRFSKKEKEEVI